MFKNKTIVTIFLTIFIDLLGVGILIPVIPLLFASPLSEFYILPTGVSVQTGYLLLGLLIAVYPIGQFLATPILGQLSDRYGRKKILAVSLLGTCISYILFAVGIVMHNIPLLFISRFFDGLTGGNISVAQAMISDVSTKENRAKNFGMIGAAFGLGFIFGPFIGGKLSDPHTLSWFTATTPFYFAAILAFINMMLVLFVLKETNNNLQTEKITWNRSIRNIIEALKIKGVNTIFLTSFLFSAGFTFFTTFFSVYLIKKFGFDQGNIGDFFAWIGIWSVIVQGFLVKIVAKKFSEEKVIKFSLIGCGVIVLAYFLPQHSWQLYLIPPFFSLCTGLTMSNLGSLLSKSTKPEVAGKIFGINSSVQALAQLIPAIISGFVAAILAPESPIVIASIFILFGALAFIKLYKPVA
jgi:DHA1 family tetracycline resistance protein-like MFS transporter